METTRETAPATRTPAVLPSQEIDGSGRTLPAPQSGAATCPTCGSAATAPARSYIYALGRIVPRFSTPAAEREFAQVVGQTDTKGLTDREILHTALSKRENRYLARQVCWVLTIEGLETYVLTPHDPMDFDLLIEAVRREPSPMDMDVVIGVRGPIAPPGMCNGLMIPIVAFDQIYSFDRETLIRAIPKPDKADAKRFAATAFPIPRSTR